MRLTELRTILKTQKYPKMVVEKGIEKALAIPQKQLRSEKLKKKDDILPFISTYNPNNPNVFPKVREIYRNLQSSKTLGKILQTIAIFAFVSNGSKTIYFNQAYC